MTKILIVVLAFVVCNCQSDNPGVSSSWAKLQISQDSFSSMEYGNFYIEIYEHVNNHMATTIASQKKYFYAPTALLDNKSAVSTYNMFTKQPEMRFRVEMWNDKVQNEVVKHLNRIVGHEIESDKVRVIPLEKVILTSDVPTEGYSLSPLWTNYRSKSKFIWFSFSCYEQKICDALANEMRSVPKHIDHFKLLYSLSSQTSQTKQTIISFESVSSSRMVANLLQKFGDKKEVYLTTNDEKKMLAEMATNIRMETFDDSEVGLPNTETQIYNILKDLMIMSRTNIKEQSDKMWDSVFWDEDNYRPDKTTKTLNEIVNKLDKETLKKITEMFQSGKTQHNSNSWADVDGISLAISEKISNDSDFSFSQIEMLNVEKLLQESRSHVQWDGRKFVPKTMQLGRINLDKFRDPQSFQDRNVRVRYTNAELSAPIKFVEHAEFTVTDEWNNLKDKLEANAELLNTNVLNLNNLKDELKANAELLNTNVLNLNNLKDELKANAELLNKTVMNLVKTNTELDNAKRDLTNTRMDLTNTRMDLTNKLEGTNLELEKTKINFQKTRATVVDLSTKLNATEKELVEMKTKAENLSIELKTNSQRLDHELKVVEDTLRKELKGSEELFHTTDLMKTNTELINVKKDLSNTRIDLTKKFEVSKQELEETKIKIEKTRSHVNELSTNLNATNKEMAEMKIRTGNFLTELKTNSYRLGHEIKIVEEKLKKELRATLTTLETTTTNLNATRTELSGTKYAVADLTTKLNTRTSEIVDIGKMPTSCADLQRMGHKLSGFFSVKGSKKMEMIYCDFYPNQNDKEKWIGYSDVKSAPVHFYVQRNSSWDTKSIPIPFDLAVVNDGNAMNLTTGKFTAPRPGIYFFSFTGLVRFPSSSSRVYLDVFLYLNGGKIGTGSVQEAKTVADQFDQVTVQSTLTLKKGDLVWVAIFYTTPGVDLNDNNNHYTHFTGFMLEGEIAASL